MQPPGDVRADNLFIRNAAPASDRVGWMCAILIAAAFFAAAAPTLAWLEFSNTMENLVVAAALETRHTGHWMVPDLEGEPRVAKPPLATWITAAAMRASTLDHLDDPTPSIRASAYTHLAFEVRWPALLASCLSLLAVYAFGREIVGVGGGLLAIAIAGTTLYFARFGRQATTDVYLALGVAVADAALARMILRRITWPTALIAAAAIGFAFMTKGPIALLFTLAPTLVYLCFARYRPRARWMPIVIAFILFIVIGGWWYVYVGLRVPQAARRWGTELTVADSGEHAGSIFCYTSIFLYVLPWTAMFIFGLVWSCISTKSRDRWLWVLLMVLIPAIAMTFFRERRERYMLPLLAPAALLIVRGCIPMLHRSVGPRIPDWIQWMILFALAIGFPLAGARGLHRADGTPWYPQAAAIGIALVLSGILIIGILASRFTHQAIFAATVVLMLMLEPIFFAGYRASAEGQSDLRPLAEFIRARYPTAEMYNWRPDVDKRASVDFSIYMNRPTRWTPDPTTLPTSNRPQIYVTLRDRASKRDLQLPGWRYLAAARRDANTSFAAFIRATH